jgi:hypothetical protein
VIRDRLARTLQPGPRSFKRRGRDSAHRITIDCKPGRAPTPVVTKWSCSCGEHGDWIRATDGAESNRLAELHESQVLS